MITSREYAAQKLAELRRERGYSSYFVAEQVGTNQSTIVRMESTKHKLDSSLLMRVCRLYKVPVDLVLGTYNDDVETVPTELVMVEV